MTLDELRHQHPRFYYRTYQGQLTDHGLEIEFLFQTEPDLMFRPKILIAGVTQDHLDHLSPAALNTFLFNLGMIELISYWKATCSPEIVVEAGPLDQTQLAWWHDLLLNGLGEFFFVNHIDFTQKEFVTIVNRPAHNLPPTGRTGESINQGSAPTSLMIPIGGGKDSVVTIELLKQYLHHQDEAGSLACFMVNPTQASLDVSQASGISTLIQAQRTLDPLLLQLNQQGYLNGHTPFSALVAFLSVLVARLFNYELVSVSNERSSNEGSVKYQGHDINHQFSKTFEFEKKFQQYVQTYLAGNSNFGYYFSFLRPLFELQIGRIFTHFPEYHSIFRSCNRGHKTNSWCGDCPKCLFAYAILYPFLGKEALISIFGQDLWTKSSLLPYALELTGVVEQKPLECVGTREENLAAFHLSYERSQTEYDTTPPLLQLVFDQALSRESHLSDRSQTILTSWNHDHALPTKLKVFLENAVFKTYA